MGAPSTMDPVPESVLKKRKTQEKLAIEKAKEAHAAKKANKDKRVQAYKSAEKYVKEYRALAKQRVRMHRQAKAAGNHFVDGEAKLAFVVRIRGLNDMHPKTKKILQIMRLRQMNMGVFMKISKAATEMLKRVEPYISYGYPNLKSVRELIYKRGFGKINNSACPSTTTRWLRRVLASRASCAWKTSFTRSTLSDPTSVRPTTSCGHSSCALQRVVSPRSAKASARVAKLVTVRTT